MRRRSAGPRRPGGWLSRCTARHSRRVARASGAPVALCSDRLGRRPDTEVFQPVVGEGKPPGAPHRLDRWARSERYIAVAVKVIAVGEGTVALPEHLALTPAQHL